MMFKFPSVPRRRRGFIAATVFSLSACLPLAAFAVDATDVADGTTNSGAPTLPGGTDGSLKIANTKRSFVQFQLDALPDGTLAANVQKATLRLFVSKVSRPGMLKVTALGDGVTALDETLTADSTLPAAGVDLGSFDISDASLAHFVSVDVTSYVKSLAISPTSAPAFLIQQAVANNGAKVSFDSKENAVTSHGATLQLELATDTSSLIAKTDADARYAPISAAGSELNLPGTAFTPIASMTAFLAFDFYGIYETAGLGFLTANLQALPRGVTITSVDFFLLHGAVGSTRLYLSQGLLDSNEETVIASKFPDPSASIQTVTVTPATPYTPSSNQLPLLFWIPSATNTNEVLFGAKVHYTLPTP